MAKTLFILLVTLVLLGLVMAEHIVDIENIGEGEETIYNDPFFEFDPMPEV